MATTRKKPATATKAVAARKPATKPGPRSRGDAAAASAAPSATAIATAAAIVAAPAATAPEVANAAPAAKAPAPVAEKKSAAPVDTERRRSPREKLAAPAVLQPASGDSTVDRGVQVQDLSLGGVGFVATEKFEAGEVYRITLGKGPLLLNARVRIISCNKTGHRMYRCGAEFC